MSVSSAKGLADNIGIQNLEQVLATGPDAGGLDILGVDNIALTTINGSAYPPPASTISTYQYTSTNVAINAGVPTTITGSVVLPAGTYILFATVSALSGAPLIDLLQLRLRFGATTLQEVSFQFNSTLTAPVLDDAILPLSNLYLSDGISALTIDVLANGDAGTVPCNAGLRYYKLG